jgi:hypothetical protein
VTPLLTEAGTAFVEAMGAAIRHWSHETVPARLETLARESSAGHLVAWRVRNMTVNVDDLRERWTRGLDAGDLPEARVVPGDVPLRSRLPVGYVKMNRAAGIEPGPDTPPADLAYTDGDYERALALYQAETPDTPESWAGLALCLRQLSDEQSVSALFQRPEVVAALWRATRADIVQLTMWLSS